MNSEENKTEKQKENVFAVMNSYFNVLTILRKIPPAIKYDHLAAFRSAARPIFSILLKENNNEIIYHGLSTINELFNTADVKSHATPQLLSNWYTILIFGLLSNDDHVRELSFNVAVKTVNIGFEGVNVLLLTLLRIAAKYPKNDEATASLLSSVPLFRVDHVINPEFAAATIGLLNKRTSLVDDWAQLFSTTPFPTFALALQAADKLFASLNPEENAAKDENLFAPICTIASAMITDEINQPAKQTFVISTMLNYISVAISYQSEPALAILVSLSELFPQLIEIDSKCVQSVIEAAVKLSENLTLESNPMFVFKYMRSITTILVTAEKIENREVLVIFEKFLDRFIAYPAGSLPAEYPPQIQQFALSTKEMLSLFLSSYPFPESPAFPSSHSIKDVEQPLAIMPNETYIIPGTSGDKTTFSVQTGSGQFIWETKPVFEEFFKEEPAAEMVLPESIGSAEPPTLKDDKEQLAFSNKFEEVIKSFEDKLALDSPLDQIDDAEENIGELIADIDAQFAKYKEEDKTREYSTIRPPVNVEMKAASFLASTGLIVTENADKLRHAQFSENVHTLITKTLGTTHRVRVKSALLYAGSEHYDQNKIFKISLEETSPRFKEFISLLGWNVQMKKFPCYAGGLDTAEDRNGTSSIYTNGFDYELMYHCSPLLVCGAKDDQFVAKKKHIGNDHIQVVFVENDEEYEALTITSQFNFVTIIVYPLQTGLYRIDVHHRQGLQWFGPLHEPTIVTKNTLAHFITSTIINSMTVLWGNTIPYSHPSLDTVKKVQQMCREQVDKEAGKVDTFEILQLYGIPKEEEGKRIKNA